MTDESRSLSPNTDDRLVSLLKQDAVPMTTLRERYGPLLDLVRTLIGVVPNCDSYLEIWPPAFRTYNIMVPNFLNLPFSLFGIGGAPKDIVGLGMYVSSRAAECPYCSAHACSFALRRGATPEQVARALVLRFAPKAIALDRQWQHGVPHAWPAVGAFLRDLTGHDFPVLSRMRNNRASRAAASMLRENLNPETTVIGLETKTLAGIVFATIVADEPLARDVRTVAAHIGVPSGQLDDAARFASNPDADPPADSLRSRRGRIHHRLVFRCRSGAGSISSCAVGRVVRDREDAGFEWVLERTPCRRPALPCAWSFVRGGRSRTRSWGVGFGWGLERTPWKSQPRITAVSLFCIDIEMGNPFRSSYLLRSDPDLRCR